jgi:hypothetical protein
MGYYYYYCYYYLLQMGLYQLAVCYNARQEKTIQYNNTHRTKLHTTLKVTLNMQNYKKKSGT